MKTTRRGFVMGCSAAIAALSGSQFNSLAFGAPSADNDEILLTIFLRGGMDGLNFIPPIAGADRGFYESARPDLQVPTTGPDAALSLNGQLGMHPRAASLFDLFQDGRVSVIHGIGLDEPNRSHFDAMRSMELGVAESQSSSTGWLTRHLRSATNLPDEIVMPSLAVANTQQASLLGDFDTVNMTDPNNFRLNTGPSRWRAGQRTALRHLLERGSDWLHTSGVQALDALDIVELNVGGSYTPSNGAVYPNTSFGDHLETVAQIIKLGLGLRVGTIDLGGWDTHNGQGDGAGGYFGDRIEQLANGLAALYQDLDGGGSQNYTSRLTVVVQSEFGRRLRQNADRGTDHGHGNVMVVLSGNANGGVHGVWPGLSNGQLFDGADLAVTTDYRRVLSEILIRRMGNPNLGEIFPGYTDYQPLGVVSGPDIPPIYGPEIFSNGFESGGLDNWSSSVG